jgi:hypothetical protein
MEETPQGLVVRTVYTNEDEDENPLLVEQRHNFQVLSLETGKVEHDAWRQGGLVDRFKNTMTHSTNFVVHDGSLVFSGRWKLIAMDLETGERRTLARLNLEDSDEPWWLELLPDGYLLGSDQNLVLFDFEGHRTFHVFRQPPTGFDSGFDRLVTSLLINQLPELKIGSRVRIGLRADPWEGVFEMFTSYSATAESEDFVFMLEEAGEEGESRPQLVRIRKASGEQAGRVPLRTLSPDFIVDRFSGDLLLRTGKSTITCRRFVE